MRRSQVRKARRKLGLSHCGPDLAILASTAYTMDAPNNNPSDFSAVQTAINERRHRLGEQVWNHIGIDRQSMIAVGECAARKVNFHLFIQWRSGK